MLKPLHAIQRHGPGDRAISLTQIWRDGPIAIFEANKPGNFEVVVVKTRKANPNWAAHAGFLEVECYPSNEEWGLYGWTFMTLAEAKSKATALSVA